MAVITSQEHWQRETSELTTATLSSTHLSSCAQDSGLLRTSLCPPSLTCPRPQLFADTHQPSPVFSPSSFLHYSGLTSRSTISWSKSSHSVGRNAKKGYWMELDHLWEETWKQFIISGFPPHKALPFGDKATIDGAPALPSPLTGSLRCGPEQKIFPTLYANKSC